MAMGNPRNLQLWCVTVLNEGLFLPVIIYTNDKFLWMEKGKILKIKLEESKIKEGE